MREYDPLDDDDDGGDDIVDEVASMSTVSFFDATPS